LHMYIYDEILLEIQIRDINMHFQATNGSASNYY
jgi:ppGpp synthetase/RelA/SpoT-type nucleotidyltranferase